MTTNVSKSIGAVVGAAVQGALRQGRLGMVVVLAIACADRAVAGANRNWNGGGANNNWSTANNWGGNAVSGNQDLVFAGSTQLANNNDLTGAAATNATMTFAAGAGAFTLSGNTLTLDSAAALTNSSANTQTINLAGLALTNATPTIAATAGSFVISSPISGAATSLTFTAGAGFGTTLSGANTYTGATAISSGFVQIQNASALGTTAGATSVTAGAALQLANNISVGTEALTLNGSGIATTGALRNVSGINTYGGAITLASAATIAADAGSQLNLSNTIGGNFLKTFSGAGIIAASGVISGNAGLTMAGSGTLTLSANNTVTGAVTVSSGVLRGTTSTGALGAGTLALAGGNVELANDTALNYARNTTVSTSGTIFSERLTAGAGVTHTLGTLSIGAQTLTLGTDATVTSGTAGLSFGAVTLSAAGATFNANANTLLTLASVSGNTFGFTVGGDGNTSITGVVGTTTGGLTKNGTGTLTLAGANTYSGATTISAGTVSASSIVVAAGASNLGNATSAVTLGAAGTQGTLAYTGNSATYTRGFTIGGAGGGQLVVSSAGQTLTVATGNVTGSGMFTIGGAGNTTITSAVNHTGSLTKVGSGTLTVSSSNSYSGSNVLSAGSVRVTNAFGLGVGGAVDEVILSGASLQLAADTATTFGPDVGYDSIVSANTTLTVDRQTAGAGVQHQLGLLSIGTQTLSVAAGANVTSGTAGLAFAGVTSLTGSPTFDVAANTQLLLNGGISGTTDITKTGAGILTLGAGSGHANTTVSAGQLNVNFMTALGTSSGTLSLAAGTTLGCTATNAVTVTNAKAIALSSSLSFVGPTNLDLGSGTATLSTDATINVVTGTLTLGGNVVGTGLGITKTGTGVLRLTGLAAGAYTGNTTISDGELFLDGTSILAGGTTTVVTVGSTAFLRIGASASSGSTTIVSRPGGVITSSVINSDIVFTQSGTLTTSDANINGTQTIDSGVEVAAPANYLGTVPASPVADRIILKNNASLRATTGFTLSPNQGILLQSGSATFAANAATAMIVQPTVSGSGALVKTGAGNVRLTGSNTYTGGTVIQQGIIGITSDAALGAVSGTVRIQGGELVAAQTVSGGTISGVTLDPARSVLVGNGTTSALSAQTGLSLTFGGVLAEENGAGAAGNVRIGFAGPREGTVILTGSNTYQGSTLIHAGVLEVATLANGGQASPLGRSSNAAGNLLLGSATLRFTGSSAATDRLFTIAKEAATVHNSTIEVATGTLAFTNTGSIAISGTGQRSLTLTGSGSGSIAGSISGAGADATEVFKKGTGRWLLSGNNAYTGDTHVDAGRLVIDGTNQTATVIVAAGATVSGKGTMSVATLSGNGTVEPGDSPGIMTFADITASGSLSFAFEFTGTGSPTWSNAAASVNDVLRLTDASTPFNTSFTASNVIDLYFDFTGPLAIGDTFRGGFFTDKNEDFIASVQNADFNFWVKPAAGQSATRTYNGVGYVAGDQYFAAPSTFQVASANFSGGTVSNGYVMQFVAVPEPSTWAMGMIGLAVLVAPRVVRRRARG